MSSSRTRSLGLNVLVFFPPSRSLYLAELSRLLAPFPPRGDGPVADAADHRELRTVALELVGLLDDVPPRRPLVGQAVDVVRRGLGPAVRVGAPRPPVEVVLAEDAFDRRSPGAVLVGARGRV